MELNADFTARAIVHSHDEPWIASPMAGVDRRMLDRIGDEVARATTIVRYAPKSAFSAHTHAGGEEFIVLDGVFQDEHGDYPKGTYVRNPPTTAHTPRSQEGCTIFVKLWQFAPEDRTQFQKNMSDHLGESREGVRTALLHQDDYETVSFHTFEAGALFTNSCDGGLELLMIEGSAIEGNEPLKKGSWLRLPDGASLSLKAGEEGAKVWVKTGHLRHVKAPKVSSL